MILFFGVANSLYFSFSFFKDVFLQTTRECRYDTILFVNMNYKYVE